MTSDYRLGGASDEAAKSRIGLLLKQFQASNKLPAEDKNVVNKLLDVFLTMKHLRALAR